MSDDGCICFVELHTEGRRVFFLCTGTVEDRQSVSWDPELGLSVFLPETLL